MNIPKKGTFSGGTRKPDRWFTVLARALRDGRGAKLKPEDVVELCRILSIAPAKVSRYFKAKHSIAIGSDEQISVTKLMEFVERRAAITSNPKILAKHRRIRQRLEDEQREMRRKRRGESTDWFINWKLRDKGERGR